MAQSIGDEKRILNACAFRPLHLVIIGRNNLLNAPVTSFPALQHRKRGVPSAPPPDKSSRRKLKGSLVESRRGSPMSVTDRLLCLELFLSEGKAFRGNHVVEQVRILIATAYVSSLLISFLSDLVITPHRRHPNKIRYGKFCSGMYMTVKDRQLPMRIPLSGDDTRLLSLHHLPLCSIMQILK